MGSSVGPVVGGDSEGDRPGAAAVEPSVGLCMPVADGGINRGGAKVDVPRPITIVAGNVVVVRGRALTVGCSWVVDTNGGSVEFGGSVVACVERRVVVVGITRVSVNAIFDDVGGGPAEIEGAVVGGDVMATECTGNDGLADACDVGGVVTRQIERFLLASKGEETPPLLKRTMFRFTL